MVQIDLEPFRAQSDGRIAGEPFDSFRAGQFFAPFSNRLLIIFDLHLSNKRGKATNHLISHVTSDLSLMSIYSYHL